MSVRARVRAPLRVVRDAALALLLLPATTAVHAQTWTADLYAGGTRYQSLSDRVSTTNLIGNLRFQSLTGLSAYLSAAVPVDGDASVWGAAGATKRFEQWLGSAFSFGLESSVHGYGFREDPVRTLSGGASLQALPFGALNLAGSVLELRGGWNHHVFSYADTSGDRGMLELGARASRGNATLHAQLEGRWLSATDADYPYAGVQLAVAPKFGRVWGWAGRWFADELNDAVWGVGASAPIAGFGEVWLTVRHDAADPLFESSARRSWNIGISRQLGGPRAPAPAMVPKLTRGAVQIRLPVSAVPGDRNAAPSVAGEFSEWKPSPMRRDGDSWVIELPLGAGAYRFSFVTAGGEWFVPPAYPGRLDDGMGGHVVLIVVP